MYQEALDLVGYHIGGSVQASFDLKLLADQGVKWAQIFLSNPKRMVPPSTSPMLNGDNIKHMNLVVHGPFTVNTLNKEEKLWSWTLNHMLELAEICHQYGIKHIVTHTGLS